MFKITIPRQYGFLLCIFALLVFFSACVSTTAATPATTAPRATRPAWISDVYSVFDRNLYVAALGQGNDLVQAERSAFANLTATFGQAIQVSETLSTSYHEMVRSGMVADWSESTALESVIETSASLDALLGSEIRERHNEGNLWFAVAVMDRAKAAPLYIDIISANLAMIDRLLAMAQTEGNSLEGFSRFQAAATIADMNVSFENVVRQLGATPPAGVTGGEEFRLAAANIIREIPINVTVKNDRAGRIQGAIARVFADLGFRSGGTNSRYMVQAELELSEANVPNQNAFVRYEFKANFVDANTNAILIPFDINGREGHATMSEAENRAIRAVERRIETEFSEMVNRYLAQLQI